MTPVPIPAIIPAIEGASRFQLIKAATPKVINTSENIVMITESVIFIFLYLIKRITEIIRKTTNASKTMFFVNSFPRAGEIVSSFTTSSLYGRLPVIKIVCSLFMFSSAFLKASSCVVPVPGPDIETWVVTLPLRLSPMRRLSTGMSSR